MTTLTITVYGLPAPPFPRVYLHGRRVGVALSDWGAPRTTGQPCWTVRPHKDGRWGWTAPTRWQAVTALITWLQEQP